MKFTTTIIAGITLCTIAQAETFVLVHGAFQDKSCWTTTKSILEQNGHKVLTPDLPGRNGVGLSQTPLTLINYKDVVIKTITQQPEPVILVGHSFAGFTISGVAEAIPNKIQSLVYLAAYIPNNGDSLQTLSSQDIWTKFNQENFVISKDFSTAEVLDRDQVLIFGNDADVSLQKKLKASMIKEPLAPASEKINLNGKPNVPIVYIQTLRDNAVSTYFQAEMITRNRVDRVFQIDSGHAPYTTQPIQLNRILDKVARLRIKK